MLWLLYSLPTTSSSSFAINFNPGPHLSVLLALRSHWHASLHHIFPILTPFCSLTYSALCILIIKYLSRCCFMSRFCSGKVLGSASSAAAFHVMRQAHHDAPDDKPPFADEARRRPSTRSAYKPNHNVYGLPNSCIGSERLIQ